LPRPAFIELLRPGDLVIANDAATLPASLAGKHQPTGLPIEVRLAGCRSLAADRLRQCLAVVFGEGDFRTRTEDRPLPPIIRTGDRLTLGPLEAEVQEIVGHPRLVQIAFQGSTDEIWQRVARHGRPIQYAHIAAPLSLWDVWTPIAGPPVAFEPPSAGFAIDWNTIAGLKRRGIQFTTITHAAGISSTGDPELDARLPFDEPYRIPAVTARAIFRARNQGRRVIAIGTTVVRALEHASMLTGSVVSGEGIATQRIGATTKLHVVDAILSGTHEAGSSHHELLKAFVEDDTLRRMDEELNSRHYRTHEFGDSIMVERSDFRRASVTDAA
jgi:S-adenosylmethionine:tRNA ribosyltransferase-isomerase